MANHIYISVRLLIGLVGAIALSSKLAVAQQTAAEYAYVLDVETGVALYEKNAHLPMAPASMSKLMTVLMVFDALKDGRLKLEDEFYVSEHAWRAGGAASGGSTMFLDVKSKASIADLLRGVIVQSGNDACIVLAEGLAGSEDNFALAMTERAHELGLKDSTFTNSTGLPDPNHMMSARDLAYLAKLLVTDYAEYYSLFSERTFTWNGITQSNRNPLLFSNMGADGLKTGHTEDSGYGLTASAEQNGRRIVVVLNGLTSKRQRASEARSMLNWGFRSFTSTVLYGGGMRVTDIPVWQGDARRAVLVPEKQVKAILPRTGRRNIAVTVTYDTPAMAPIKKGDKLGSLRVTAPNMASQQFDLVAESDIARAGIFGRAFSAAAYLMFGDR